MQGAAGNVIVLQPTKTAMTFCDIDPGRWIDVPANFQKWEEAQPKNLHVVHLTCQFFLHCCRNLELLSIKYVWFC